MSIISKLTASQIALCLLAFLLTLTPLFSSSLRPTYIYIIFNLLIIALGAQAGLLSNPNPNHDNSKHVDDGNSSSVESSKMETRSCAATKKTAQVRKCPSTPSLFFIGCGDSQVHLQGEQHVRVEIRDNDMEEEEEEEEEDDGVGGQELFTKAENFIGNFYKQLNMQREDSGNKIHEF